MEGSAHYSRAPRFFRLAAASQPTRGRGSAAARAYGATGYPQSGPDAGKLIGPGEDLYVEVRLRSIALSKGVGFGLNLI